MTQRDSIELEHRTSIEETRTNQMAYAYTFVIETQGEYDALVWASARWNGATVLYDLMHAPEDWDGETFPATMGLAEHEAWQVKEAIDAEDAGFIPCLADSLNSRIMAMLDSIV